MIDDLRLTSDDLFLGCGPFASKGNKDPFFGFAAGCEAVALHRRER